MRARRLQPERRASDDWIRRWNGNSWPGEASRSGAIDPSSQSCNPKADSQIIAGGHWQGLPKRRLHSGLSLTFEDWCVAVLKLALAHPEGDRSVPDPWNHQGYWWGRVMSALNYLPYRLGRDRGGEPRTNDG